MTTAVRVISVIGSPRRKSFQQPPPELGFDCRFLDAAMDVIDGVEVDELLCYKHCGRLLVKGEIGNFCSHVLAWQELLADKQFTQMIVLEDDVLADWLAVRQIANVDWSQHGSHIHEIVLEVSGKSRREILVLSYRRSTRCTVYQSSIRR